MNGTQATAGALFSWLKTNGPFNGTVHDMALALGVNDWDIHNALYWLRHPDVVKATGWLIPKQPRGNAYNKDWRVLDINDGLMTADERASSAASTERTNGEIVRLLGKVIAMLDVEHAKSVPNSSYRRTVNQARRAIDGAQAMVENAPVPV